MNKSKDLITLPHIMGKKCPKCGHYRWAKQFSRGMYEDNICNICNHTIVSRTTYRKYLKLKDLVCTYFDYICDKEIINEIF